MSHLQLVVHVIDAECILGDVFGETLLVAILDRSRECHDAVTDANRSAKDSALINKEYLEKKLGMKVG